MSVCVITTGGTITSHWDGTTWRNIGGQALVDEIAAGGLAADVRVVDVAAGPSSGRTLVDMFDIAGRIADELASSSQRAGGPGPESTGVAGHGVVVVHGTDTMGLAAFAAQLVLGTDASRPAVAFTGSMRVHSHALPDGPRNVRDAVAVAASSDAVGHGVMVCMEGALHAADRVRKVDAASLDAFTSAPFAPVGMVESGRVRMTSPGAPRRPLGRIDTATLAPVPLVTCVPGIEAVDIERAIGSAPAAVVEGFGDLNLPPAAWAPLHGAAARGCVVVVASRAYTPSTATETLDALGAVGAGGLCAQKARLAVAAALAAGLDRDGIATLLGDYRLCRDAGDRSTT